MPPDQTGESWRDAALLLDMALAAEDALSFVAGLDERAFLASDLLPKRRHPQLEVIGEAAGRVSKSFCAAHPEIPWREMTGLRHRLHPRLWRRAARYRVGTLVTETLPGPHRHVLRPLIPSATDHDDD